MVFLDEATRQTRELTIDACENAVVVDWRVDGEASFEASVRPHLSIESRADALDGLKQLFDLLEGLGYLQEGEQGQLSAEQNAELVEKLKELGYV